MTRRVGVLLCGLGAAVVHAQDIEPRAYANAPIGVNFVIAALAFTEGNVAADPALPITDAQITTNTVVMAYARTVDFWGNSGKIAAYVPYASLDGSASFAGQPQHREVSGAGDARVRMSMNFLGAPALSLREFRNYQQDTILGASIEVSLPTGQYDRDKLVNNGGNRWSVRPELGLSQAIGDFTAELSLSATIFSDNDQFLGNQRREQDPLYSAQGHLIYSPGRGVWFAFTGTYVNGGQTMIDGRRSNDRQRNTRIGATVVLPVDRNHSVKLFASTGVSSRTGGDYDLLGAAWQYRWGGGL